MYAMAMHTLNAERCYEATGKSCVTVRLLDRGLYFPDANML